jgi:hypothetical protein
MRWDGDAGQETTIKNKNQNRRKPKKAADTGR